MEEVKAFILRNPESEPVNDQDIYLPSEEFLLNAISATKRIAELSEKLTKSHLTFAEKQELRDLSRAVQQHSEAILKDLYPEHRPGNPVIELEKNLDSST